MSQPPMKKQKTEEEVKTMCMDTTLEYASAVLATYDSPRSPVQGKRCDDLSAGTLPEARKGPDAERSGKQRRTKERQLGGNLGVETCARSSYVGDASCASAVLTTSTFSSEGAEATAAGAAAAVWRSGAGA